MMLCITDIIQQLVDAHENAADINLNKYILIIRFLLLDSSS